MFEYETQIWLYGTLVHVNVEYQETDDSIDIEKVAIVGVYHKGDNPRRRDYTSLGTDIPLCPTEMTAGMYEELVIKAEEHLDISRFDGNPDYEA